MAAGRLNLLLVDDDEVDVEAMARALARAGAPMALHVARHGEEALAMLRRGLPRPLVILLDLNMPVMDGLEFLRELRRDDELRGSIVFVLTTSAHETDQVRAYEHGVAGYVLKSDVAPDYAELLALLRCYGRIVTQPAPRARR